MFSGSLQTQKKNKTTRVWDNIMTGKNIVWQTEQEQEQKYYCA